jgi:integrase
MAKRLTVKTIEALKPRDKSYEIPDGEIRGMYVVVQPSGEKSHVLRYRHAGRTRKWTIGPAEMGLAEARKLAASGRAAIAARRDPAGEKRAAKEAVRETAKAKRDSVEAVVDEFVAKHVRRSNKPSTGKEYERLLAKEIVGPWGERRLEEITRRDVNLMLDEIVDRGSPVAANRVLAILRKFCLWAVSREIIPASPCEGVTPRSIETPRDCALDDHELRLVEKARGTLGYPYAAIVGLLLLTGQRRGEVVGMRWSEINFSERVWSPPPARTKNKRPHALPLSPAAIEILQALPRIVNDGGLVFPAGVVRRAKTNVPVSAHSAAKLSLDRAIATLAEAEGADPVAPFSFHDLRRSFASGLAKLGVDLHVIERCLNHVSGSFGGIVAVYQKHKFEDAMRRAVDAWGAHVERLASGAKAANVVELATARG